MADILAFPGNPGAPITPIVPRTEFGQRKRQAEFNGLAALFDEEAVRPEDRAEIDRVKRAAREARNALDGRHIDPSLRAELSAKVGVIAELCEAASVQAKFLGELRAAVTLREHQSLLETLSAELVP